MKKHKTSYDPYREVIDLFNQNGVRYVVIGMAGINYYGTNTREIFATLDYDIFLEPLLSNVHKALKILELLGFSFGISKGVLKSEQIRKVIRDRQTIAATNTDGIMIELILRVSGFAFSELSRDAATFTIRGIPVRVGRLNKLLQSKKLAGRPKDRRFLKYYESFLSD